jgi:hypothetical protein
MHASSGALSEDQKVKSIMVDTVLSRFKQYSADAAALMGDEEQAVTYFVPVGTYVLVLLSLFRAPSIKHSGTPHVLRPCHVPIVCA